VLRRRIELADPRDPQSRQPYHAAEHLGLAPAEALLARYAEDACRRAHSEIASVVRGVQARAVACALLTSSGRQGTSLEAILAAHTLIHTADGEHYRDAVRHAAGRLGLELMECPEREVVSRAGAALGLAPDDLQSRLKSLGRELGPPWTKDQKLATLAAWIALATAH
jgi:hypothetical protein